MSSTALLGIVPKKEVELMYANELIEFDKNI